MSCIKLREDLDVKIKSEEELQHYIRTTSEQNLKEIQQKDAERRSLVENYDKTIAELKLKLENIKINLNEERDMRSIVYPGARSLRSLIENQQMVDRWWRRVAGMMGDIDWVREGNKFVDKSGTLIQEVIQSKPASTGSAGRDLRRRIHQQVITVERKFGEILKESFITTYKVNEVKELFLELPYLIKPLFDLMKDYESQATPQSSPSDSNPIIHKLQKENEECLNKLRHSDSLLSKILSILDIKNKNPEERAKKLSADYAQLEKKCSTLKRENDSLKSKVQELQSKIQKFVISTQEESEDAVREERKATMDNQIKQHEEYQKKLSVIFTQKMRERIEEQFIRERQLQEQISTLRDKIQEYDSVNQTIKTMQEEIQELSIENEELHHALTSRYLL